MASNLLNRIFKLLTHRFRKGYISLDVSNNNSNINVESIQSFAPSEFVAKKWPQFLVTFIVSIGAFGNGNSIGWSAPALPNMEERGDFVGFKSDSDIATWIGSIILLGCLVSALSIGFFLQRVGRKWSMFLHGPVYVAGWLVMVFAPTLQWILVGRFITGFCGASISLAIIIYIGEVADAHIRGTLCNATGLACGLGILFTYTMGSLFSWSYLSLISALVPAVFTIGVLFIPESPYYSLQHGETDKALESLKWLRGASREDQIVSEFISKRASVQNQKQTTWSDALTPSVMKPFGICMMLVAFQQLGGFVCVMFYSVTMFTYAGTGMNPNLAAIVLAAAQVIVLLASTFTVENWGRRMSIMTSEIGMTFSLGAFGFFFYLKQHNESTRLEWLPLTILIVYVLSFNLGVGPVTWTLVSELLPSNSKGLTSSIIAGFSHGLAFLLTKFFLDLQIIFTPSGCYWFFGGASFAGFIFCLVFVPETKGKKLQDIANFFKQ